MDWTRAKHLDPMCDRLKKGFNAASALYSGRGNKPECPECGQLTDRLWPCAYCRQYRCFQCLYRPGRSQAVCAECRQFGQRSVEAIGTGDVWAEREAAIKLAGAKDNEEENVKPGVDRASQNRGASRSPGGAGRIGSPAGQDALGSLARRGRIGIPAGRGRIGTRGEAGRKQKLKVDNEEEKIFSYVNNKEMAAMAGHAEAGAGLGSQIPQDR